MNDLIYQWKTDGAVHMVANLSLPGGFKMDSYDSVNCDVKTATGITAFTMAQVIYLLELQLQ